MADNRISETRHPADTDQKHDDPLAELARIVGFEDEGNNAADNEAESGRAESGFDLEAELMRELQIDVGDDVEQVGAEPVIAASEPTVEHVQQEIQATASKIANEQIVPVQAEEPEKPAQEPADRTSDGAWPHAMPDKATQMNSLEAELQAAFSALEGSRPKPEPVVEAEPEVQVQPEPEVVEATAPVEEPVQVEEPVRMPAASAEPIDALSESDELKEAYDKLQRDIEAAKPLEDELGDGGSDLTEMLLAEMAEVEAEAADSIPAATEIPFDPSDIAESDTLPETMADLDVPEYETEAAPTLRPKDNPFGLPLEDELDVLTAPDPVEEPVEIPQQAGTYAQADLDAGDPNLEPTAINAAPAGYADPATRSTQAQYDDEPGMEGYPDDYDEDIFPGDDDFAPEDLVPPNFADLDNGDNERSGRRGLVAAAVVLGIAVISGAGFYLWNSSLGGGSSDGPLIIAANNDPVKVRPEDPGGKTVPNEDLAVFDEISGNDTSGGQDQVLVTTTEEPIDVVQRTLDPDTLPLEGRTTAADPTAKSEDRLAETNTLDPDPSADAGASGIAPRKVRTLVVKPDGTIVAREEPVSSGPAPGPTNLKPSNTVEVSNTALTTGTTATVGTATSTNAAPAATTDPVEVATASGTLPVVEIVPKPAGSAASSSESRTAQTAALPPIDENLRNSGALPLPEARPVTAAQAATGTQSTTEVASAQTNSGDLRAAAAAPVPSTRPAEQPVNIVEAVTERGNLAGSTQTANPGGYMMQISSQPSEAAARASYENLSQRYASIIGGKGVDFQRADIPNRGVFFRVRIPAGSKDSANSLCARYKSAGGSCFVAR
ncbi:MAG: hypothetical protein GY933_26220 [Hyphomicrobiales bacterium]|nr:hypothetical protein [Hyphomicrobiales bacterium]